MLDENLIDSLPDDSDEALAALYKSLKSRLDADQTRSMETKNAGTFSLESSRRTLLNIIFAFLAAHEMNLNLDLDVPIVSDDFEFYFVETTEKVEYYIAKTTFEKNIRDRSGTTAVYVLSSELKAKIHRYLSSIREIISVSPLTDAKRSVLSKKLNSFANEVDRNKTRIEALASAIIWTRKEVVEGVNGLEPIVEKLDKMFESFAKATEFLRFPLRDPNQQLPSPPKRIEGPKTTVEEDVPF